MINPMQKKHLEKLSSVEAQIAVVNLEDGIADSKKEEALFAAAKTLSLLENSKAQIAVRTNPIDSVYFKKELEIMNIVKPDALRIPKIRSVDEVKMLDEIVDGEIDIHLSIETKEAFAALSSLKVSKRVTTVFLGAIDLLEDLGLGSHLIENRSDTLKYIMCKFLVDAKTAGFTPLSFVYQNYADMDGFRGWLEIEKGLGFEAKACISPTQVAAANEFFSPDRRSIDDALYIKDIYEQNEAIGNAGFKDERFGFIDAPIYKNALLTLKKAGLYP
jgi:citrate lyase subunit beta/citryl-CoA lyase